MYQGEVAALPYVLDEMTGCDYCGCRDICGFDQRIEGCEYRRLRKYTLEEALNSMKERLGILEEKGRQENERKMDRRTTESNRLA